MHPTSPETELLRRDKKGVSVLTLNRPKQLNSFSETLLEALHETLDEIARDEAVRVVVLTGVGRAFSTGHDLKQMQAQVDYQYYEKLFKRSSELMLKLMELPQPVIARVDGIATAAGCQLVGTCDLAVATRDSRFAVSGINHGLFCSTPSVALSRNVARKKAFEMLITGDFIDAETACEGGLINQVVDTDKLDSAIDAFTQSILAKSPVAVATGKHMFYRQIEKSPSDAYHYAAEVMAKNMMAEDAQEGVSAFLTKRPPVWRGR